jgi:hypothetical protein
MINVAENSYFQLIGKIEKKIVRFQMENATFTAHNSPPAQFIAGQFTAHNLPLTIHRGTIHHGTIHRSTITRVYIYNYTTKKKIRLMNS